MSEYQSKGQAVFTKGEREREDSKRSNDRLEVERREERRGRYKKKDSGKAEGNSMGDIN